MLRTVLTATVCFGLVACGGGSHQSKRATSARAASAPHTTAKASGQQHKRKGTRADTTRGKNPLTN